jgi:hypothetical protein
MGLLGLIPIGINLLMQIFHKEKTVTGVQAGPTKKAAVLTAVQETVQTVLGTVAPQVDKTAVQSHLSTAIDEVVYWLNLFGIFKSAAGT